MKISNQEKFILNNYKKFSKTEFRNLYNYKDYQLNKISKKFNIKYQRSLNGCVIDYFNTWSNNMAYILGFIYADGNIIKNDSNNWCLQINVSSKDKSILHFIIDQISPRSNIYDFTVKQKSGLKTKKSAIKITSNELILPLIELGLTSNKTYTPNLPLIPKKYKNSFLLGYFDGDGSISIYTKYSGKYSISCYDYNFLLKLKNYFLPLGSIYEDCRKNNCYSLEITKNDHLLKIRNYLYNNKNDFCLLRKKQTFFKLEKYITYKEIYKNLDTYISYDAFLYRLKKYKYISYKEAVLNQTDFNKLIKFKGYK